MSSQEIDVRLSPEGSVAQRFEDNEGRARWMYFTRSEHAGLQAHMATDDETADWPQLRMSRC